MPSRPPLGGTGWNRTPRWGAAGPALPTPSGDGLRTLLIAVLVIVAGLIVGLVLIGVIRDSLPGGGPTPPRPTGATLGPPMPTPSPSTSSPTPRPTSSPRTTQSSSRTPSPRLPTTKPRPIPGPSGVGRAEARPDPVPQPRTWARAADWTRDNPLYRRKLTVPTRCGVPLIDPGRIATEALRRHLDRLAGCLTMVWRPAVRATGFSMPYPVVSVYTGDATGPCGRMNAYNAYYCSASQRIYFGTLLHQVLRDRDYSHDLILAHEYGHAVQGRTGILTSAWAYHYSASSKAKRSEYLRRLELQADCFAGAGLNALSRHTGINAADRTGFAEVLSAIADDTLAGRIAEHGSATARVRWLSRGLGSAGVDACRTFTAAADRVR